MSEDNEFNIDAADEELNRTEAGKFLKVDPRTIVRWQKAGLLKQTPNRKYLKSELLAFKKRSEEDPDFEESPDDAYFGQLTQALALSNQHNERIISLIDKPLTLVLGFLKDMVEQAQTRIKESDAVYLESMRQLGDTLLQKEEREAMAGREAVKTGLMANAGENLMNLLPLLVAQMGGKKSEVKVEPAKEGQPVSAFSQFIASLEPSELQQLMALRAFFDGEKKERFEAALAEAGISEAPHG